MAGNRKNKPDCGLRRLFTLIEIIVAMGVFGVLMAVAMQFFAGAQRIWSSSESRSNVYADGRIAMNLMATLLQSSYYADLPMVVVRNRTRRSSDDTYFDAIYFPVKSDLRPRGSAPLFAAAFVVPDCAEDKDAYNDLMIATVCSEDGADGDDYKYVFERQNHVSFAINMYRLLSEYAKDAANKGDDGSDLKAESVVSHVTSFRITPVSATFKEITPSKKYAYYYGASNDFDWKNGDNTTEAYCYPSFHGKDGPLPPRPPLVKIEIGILPDPYFERWKEASGDDKKKIKDEQEVKFTRIVCIGEQGQS